MAFVHRPEIVELVYEAGAEPPPLLQRFQVVFNELDITQDPYMIRLWAEDYAKYVELLTSRKTYCQIQVKRLLGMATEVNNELGPWASGHYIYMCVRKFQSKKQPAFQILENMNEEEKHYLQQQVFDCLPIPKSDKKAMLCDQDLSRKARMLLTVLVNEMHEGSAGIVFVKTRAAVKLLSVLLSRHPSTKDILKVGTFVGMSNNQARTSSISDLIDINEQKDTLEDLRNGGKNLIIATSVCEEGIDISACNIVICFEKPPNLKSFIQRRGRARRSSSKYVIMLSKADRETVSKWEGSEAEMIMKYMDDKRELGQSLSLEDGEQGHREFVVRSTK
jgi:ERCC4-related helicase